MNSFPRPDTIMLFQYNGIIVLLITRSRLKTMSASSEQQRSKKTKGWTRNIITVGGIYRSRSAVRYTSRFEYAE